MVPANFPEPLSADALAPAPSIVKHGVELILFDWFAHNVKLAIFI